MSTVRVSLAEISPVEAVTIDADYDLFINRVAREGDDRTITNGSSSHALSILRAMFRYGKQSIDLFTGSLAPDVYNDDELVKLANDFLKNGGQLQVLMQSVPALRPSKLLALALSYGNPEKVKVRCTLPEHVLAKDAAHFVSMDGRAYRLEDIESHTAVVSFCDEIRAQRLGQIFAKVFNIGTVPVAVAV